jgi:hypothetical protein
MRGGAGGYDDFWSVGAQELRDDDWYDFGAAGMIPNGSYGEKGVMED